MKTKIISAVLASIIALSTKTFEAEIPRETVPQNATEEQIIIVENLIWDILDEVAIGSLGFTEAAGYANARVRKAVISGQTNGHDYVILLALNRTILDILCSYLRECDVNSK